MLFWSSPRSVNFPRSFLCLQRIYSCHFFFSSSISLSQLSNVFFSNSISPKQPPFSAKKNTNLILQGFSMSTIILEHFFLKASLYLIGNHILLLLHASFFTIGFSKAQLFHVASLISHGVTWVPMVRFLSLHLLS